MHAWLLADLYVSNICKFFRMFKVYYPSFMHCFWNLSETNLLIQCRCQILFSIVCIFQEKNYKPQKIWKMYRHLGCSIKHCSQEAGQGEHTAQMHCIGALGQAMCSTVAAILIYPFYPLSYLSIIFLCRNFYFEVILISALIWYTDGGGIRRPLHQARSSLPQYELWVVHPGPRLRVQVSSQDVICHIVDQYKGHMSWKLLAMDAGRFLVHRITGVLPI